MSPVIPLNIGGKRVIDCHSEGTGIRLNADVAVVATAVASVSRISDMGSGTFMPGAEMGSVY